VSAIAIDILGIVKKICSLAYPHFRWIVSAPHHHKVFWWVLMVLMASMPHTAMQI